MNQLPPLNALRAFDVAGRHLNFRAAADEMGVTQGAVAQQVRQLEAHLGIQLFDRLPKGLAFTAAGRAYYARVSAAFADLQTATETLYPASAKVLVSVTPTFAAKWLIPNLPEFSASHPQVDLRILATEKLSSFHGDGIDLAIRQTQPPFGASLEAIRLFRQEVIAVASPAFVAGHHLPLDREALAGLRKLHDAHDLWPPFLAAIGVADRSGHGLRLSQTSLAIEAAVSGQGIALVSRFLAERDIAANRLVDVVAESMPGKQDFYLLALRGPKRSPSVQTVIDWLVSKGATAP